MQPDFDKSAAAMVAGTAKAIQGAVAPLLKRIEQLEVRPAPERGEKGEHGDPGRPGSDGVGLAGALIDRSGVLVLTLTDGTTRELGVVVGKDGEPGKKGELGERGDAGEKGDLGPKGEKGDPGTSGEKGIDGRDGRDGTDGKDGRDGFDLESFDVVPKEDGRTIELRFARGDAVHCFELKFPVAIYRGVFKEGEPYAYGDLTTWAGSVWHSQKTDNLTKPGTNEDWVLAVKAGRHGRDAGK